jgi:AraC-like DNA-binding protein
VNKNKEPDIEQHWLRLAEQANWSVKKLAKLNNTSIRSLERRFLKMFAKTPKAWLTKKRHNKAAKLMCAGHLVKETSAQIGYRHTTTFAREFKKYSGQCPNAYTSTFKIRSSQL